MRLLLDTHIALWALVADPRLPAQAHDLIADRRNFVFVSAASVWEIAIKHSLARGSPDDMPISGADALSFFRQSGYEFLSISAEHAAAVSGLPPLHRDPFDRMIVTQALFEPLRLITHDSMVKAYGESILLVWMRADWSRFASLTPAVRHTLGTSLPDWQGAMATRCIG